MKIAIIVPSLMVAGPVVAASNLANAIFKDGKKVKVFYFKSLNETGDWNDKKSFTNFNCETEKISFFSKKLVKDFDIIHTTGFRCDAYGFLHKHKNLKHISSVHNFLFDDLTMQYGKIKGRIIMFFWLLFLSRSDAIIAPGREMQKYYQKFFKAKNIYEIAYGMPKRNNNDDIDNHDLHRISILKNKKFKIIGSVGYLLKRKGFNQLVELLNLNKSLAVVIIGEGPYKKDLEDLINLYNLQDRYILLGYRKNSYRYNKYFDLYALTSYSEGFSLSLIDALSSGVPVVYSDLPCYLDIFNKNNASIFTPNNVDTLNAAVQRSLERHEHFSDEAQKIYYSRFSIKIMAKNHTTIYDNLINNK